MYQASLKIVVEDLKTFKISNKVGPIHLQGLNTKFIPKSMGNFQEIQDKAMIQARSPELTVHTQNQVYQIEVDKSNLHLIRIKPVTLLNPHCQGWKISI
jgi:hypothetical protein